MKYFLIWGLILPVLAQAQIKSQNEQNALNEHIDSISRNFNYTLFVDSINRANEFERRKNKIEALGEEKVVNSFRPATNPSITKVEKSPVDSLLNSLRNIKESYKNSTDPNVTPLGLSPGNYEVKDTSQMIVDLKLPKYLEQKEKENKNRTLIITIILSLIMITTIVLIIKKSINGNKPK